MKKNLLDRPASIEIIERIGRLKADTRNLWGTMNATEMLLHCNLANKSILENESPYQKPSLKERLIKFAIFYILPKLPKNNKGPLRLDVRGTIDKNQFQEQKEKYIETIDRFPVHEKPITAIHPRAGYINTKEWGIFTWMHMDHHLRQFGL